MVSDATKTKNNRDVTSWVSVQWFLSTLASCGMWSSAHSPGTERALPAPTHTHVGCFELVIISSSLSQIIRGKISLKRFSFKYYPITCFLYVLGSLFCGASIKNIMVSFHNISRFLKFWTHPLHSCLLKQHLLSKQNSVSAMRKQVWVFACWVFFPNPQIFFITCTAA